MVKERSMVASRCLRSLAFIAGVALIIAACGAEEPELADDEPDTETIDPEDEPEVEEAEDEPEQAHDEVISLLYGSYSIPGDAFDLMATWWLEEIGTRSNGRVQIDKRVGLFEQDVALAAAGEGRADISAPTFSFHPAELPMSQVAGLPFITRNPDADVRAFLEAYQSVESFQQEFEDHNVHVLWFLPGSPLTLASTSPIQSLDDFQGLRIRVNPPTADALTMVGATPVTVTLVEVYESLRRGVIDGAATGLEHIGNLAWHEPAPNVVDIGTGTYLSSGIVMNLDTWNDLPPDVQQIIEEVSVDAIEQALNFLTEIGNRSCEEILEAGTTVAVLPEEELAAWTEIVGETLIDEWKSTSDDADELFDVYTDALRRYEAESDFVSPVESCAEQSED